MSTATLRRARQAGKLTATPDGDGWRISVPALIAAGFMPRTTPPDTADDDNNASAEQEELEELAEELVQLRQALAQAEQRAAVAEAIARERGETVEVLRLALKQLPRPAETPPPTAETYARPTPTPAQLGVEDDTKQQQRRRPWWKRRAS